KRTTYLCVFPRLPVNNNNNNSSRSRESVHQPPPPTYSKRDSFRPRILPVKPQPRHLLNLDFTFPPADNYTVSNKPRYSPDPPSPPEKKTAATPRVFSSSNNHPRPLRLVQEHRPKRLPPVFVAKSTHTVIQSLTCITIRHHQPPPSPEMASSQMNPLNLPKVAPPSPPRPMPGPGGANKEQVLADLRRQQLDDSNSDGASSVGSRGSRRRRNRNNNKALAPASNAGGLTNPAVLPRLADTKPVRLQLGLNLDVELELKARLQGDVSLTLLVEKKTPAPRPSSSTELKPDLLGRVECAEIFFLRLGVLRLRQRWIGREVSTSLTAAAAAALVGGGFVAGVLVRDLCAGSFWCF
ncbi:hypothetical protein QBC39DRAFT_246508, partial [Podospora conica]